MCCGTWPSEVKKCLRAAMRLTREANTRVTSSLSFWSKWPLGIGCTSFKRKRDKKCLVPSSKNGDGENFAMRFNQLRREDMIILMCMIIGDFSAKTKVLLVFNGINLGSVNLYHNIPLNVVITERLTL